MTLVPIPGFAGRYLITEEGQVFTAINSRGNPLPAPRELRSNPRLGHSVVQLRWQSRNVHRRVEDLLALTFQGRQVMRSAGRPQTDLDAHYAIDEAGCWIWSGGLDSDGYGHMSRNRKAHRVYYERANGPIPKGLVVCHRCDVRNCVNPEHLFVGTPLDNNDDKVRKGRQVKGEAVARARLSETDVVAILASDEPCFVLASKYGVSDTAISYIRLGKTWKHVPRPEGFSYTPYRAPGDHRRWEEPE